VAANLKGPVAHHFNNLNQQLSTMRFGMWLFLVTEIMFFGGAFCAYTAYRVWFPRDFEAGSAALNAGIASVNTFLLLTSSLTITLGIRSAFAGNPKGLRTYLLATIALGTIFLGLKAREYQLDFKEGLIPNVSTLTPEAKKIVDERIAKDPSKADEKVFPFNENLDVVLHHTKVYNGQPGVDYDPFRVQLFFMFYYSMTGLHVLHMVVGLGLLTWQYILASRGFFDYTARYVYIETMSLYWHFVDMAWMFILPLLYLAGPHTAGQAVEQFKEAIGMATGTH
jgi:cytochrome c oxidase subunit 3